MKNRILSWETATFPVKSGLLRVMRLVVGLCKSVSHEWLCDYLISRLSRLIFDQIRKLLLTYWLHASKYFCFTVQWRENFFNSLPVIHISDSTLLMQETVISFEEVMQTKLKVKLCIFQPLGNPCILQKRVVFQAKIFSNSWFIVTLRSFFSVTLNVLDLDT